MLVMSEDATIRVSATTPNENTGLQAVDYFVWTLQRPYERGEDRYLTYLWEAFRLVHDIDDTRGSSQGIYYTQNTPLTETVLKLRQ